MVETERFELSGHITAPDGLANRCLRPLSHVSNSWCPGPDSNRHAIIARRFKRLEYTISPPGQLFYAQPLGLPPL
jgi:hypothetical protein